MSIHEDTSDQVISAIRRIIRAVDLHSRTMVDSHGLTGPQALLLKALASGGLSAGELAGKLSLSQGTVTDILKRLEIRGLVTRIRDDRDRRRVQVEITAAGLEKISQSPPLLQERFTQRFQALQEWEQTQLLSSLQRLATMMDAEELDAAPVLSNSPVLAGMKDGEESLQAIDPAPELS